MSAVWVAVIAGVCGIVAAGGKDIIAAALGRLRGRGTPVERVKTLNEATLQWAEELKQDAADARRELAQVREQAGQAFTELARMRTQLATVTGKVEQLDRMLVHILALVHHTPDMTLERLRTLVPEATPRGADGG